MSDSYQQARAETRAQSPGSTGTPYLRRIVAIPGRPSPPHGHDLRLILAQRFSHQQWSRSRPAGDDCPGSLAGLPEHRPRHGRHRQPWPHDAISAPDEQLRDQRPPGRTPAERKAAAAARTWAARHGWPAPWDSTTTASTTRLPAAYPLPPSHRRPEPLKPAT